MNCTGLVDNGLVGEVISLIGDKWIMVLPVGITGLHILPLMCLLITEPDMDLL